MIWANAVSFVNARVVVDGAIADSLRWSTRILSIGERPKARDTVIDLGGAAVLPGLVNAHDHLELNHYGRLKCRDRYDNASAWIADLRPRLSADPAISEGRAYPLIERVFIGGLKNLLAGATTGVACQRSAMLPPGSPRAPAGCRSSRKECAHPYRRTMRTGIVRRSSG